MDKTKLRYKCCAVPLCSNNTTRTPEKIFFNIPCDAATRLRWCKAMRRKPLAANSFAHCCEDHFNIEEDSENFLRFKLLGADKWKLKLKKDVCPHKFACQSNPRPTLKNPLFEYDIQLDVSHTSSEAGIISIEDTPLDNSTSDISHIPTEAMEIVPLDESFVNLPSTSTSQKDIMVKPSKGINKSVQATVEQKEKGIQAVIKKTFRSRGTLTSGLQKVVNIGCSPFKSKPTAISPKKRKISIESISTEMPSTSSISSPSWCPSSSDSENVLEEVVDLSSMQIKIIKENTNSFLGINESAMFVIDIFVNMLKISEADILITLYKIKHDLPYALIGAQFGISLPTTCRIFNNTIPKLAFACREFIIWPEADKIKKHLPIAFRRRYNKVVSIIDCFEIKIEKPSNSVKQAQTWSNYKSCNTIKYLISCCPDGTINFISPGYVGRTSDSVITEECGYLDHLKPGQWITLKILPTFYSSEESL